MNVHVFLFKDGLDDRDCVAYINKKPLRFECNHYFGGIHLEGPCWSGRSWNKINYDNIQTILTRNEFEQLIEFDNNIHNLGYSIKEGDERYLEGVKLCENIQPIFDKLNSEENEELFNRIIEEEKEYLMDEYSLDEDDVEFIFDNYYLDYRDRGVIACVWDNIEECAQEEAEGLGYVTAANERYFNYEKFGEDLLEEERYLELPDGRIVILNY